VRRPVGGAIAQFDAILVATGAADFKAQGG